MANQTKNDSYKKTERILYAYPALKKAIANPNNPYKEQAIKEVQRVEEALEEFVDDPYYQIIPMRYFENRTIEDIAFEIGVSHTMIGIARRKLIHQIKIFLFTDDAVEELFRPKGDTHKGIISADSDEVEDTFE